MGFEESVAPRLSPSTEKKAGSSRVRSLWGWRSAAALHEHLMRMMVLGLAAAYAYLLIA